MFASKDIFLKSSGGGYQISRSVRLRSSASAYLNKTLTAPTNNKIFTISAWVKRGLLSTSANHQILSGYVPATSFDLFMIGGSASTYTDKLVYFDNTAGYLVSTQVFRDPSAWYHIMAAVDTTQATASNRVKLYVNGTQITSFSTTNYPGLNQAVIFNSAVAHTLGSFGYNSTAYYDGYMTEFNFVDGQQLTPSSFGETNAVTGVWQPKAYSGTYGTNGFELNFSDNSTAAALGTDFSGNSNTWTVNNISVTAGSTYDSMTDVPTLTSATAANYAVVNPLDFYSNPTVTNGNLQFATSGAGAPATSRATIGVSSGKWYWEVTQTAGSARGTIGIILSSTSLTNDLINLSTGYSYNGISGNKYNGGTATAYGASYTTGDVIGVALDMDAGTIVFYKNNSSQGTAFTGLSGTYSPAFADTGGASIIYAITFAVNFGQRPFSYTPPTGFVALNTQNLPTPTISNGATVMAATTYTGTGSALTVANTVGSASFQPDLVWVKGRSGATDHAWYDAVRGVQKQLESNTTTAETTETTGLTAFGSTGFTVGALAQMNTNAATYVGWQWNAGGSTVTNTSGSISAQVRANTIAGFSVVTYTGTGSAATIGHGLGVAPQMVIVKQRNSAADWVVKHASLSSNDATLILNNTSASTVYSPSVWNNTAPTSTVFSIGTNTAINTNTNTYVAYCFAAVAGYSAFGSYTGNGSADGPFVYLGFRPRWVMFKKSSAAEDWVIFDTTRNTANLTNLQLYPNMSSAEATGVAGVIDILSNGFKVRGTSDALNTNGGTYIYAAFAENPFKLSLAR